MNCKEIKKYLDAYIDGELEAGLMLDVENHLETCEGCNCGTVVKRQLKSELEKLGETKAPEHLRAKIESLSSKRNRATSIAKIASVPLAAAAAALLLFAWPSADLPSQPTIGEPVAEVVEDVVQRHTRQLPLEVKGPDATQAANWFQGKVDFPVKTGSLNLKNASFNGARLSNVRQHDAAYMSYNVDGHRVSVMIFNPRTTSLRGGKKVKAGDKTVWLGRRNGYNVAIFLDSGMAYALSSDLSQKRLLKLVTDLH